MSDISPSRGAYARLRWWGSAVITSLAASLGVNAAEPADVRREFLAGNYSLALAETEGGLRSSPGNVDWQILRVEALLTTGRYAEADTTMKVALGSDPSSIRLRWLSREVAFANGRPAEAAKSAEEITRLVAGRSWTYRQPADLVVFGRAALLLGADPKDVLERVFSVAEKADPKLRDVYLARGELALEKHDFPLAAKAFEAGLKVLPDDPDLHSGRARAYEGGDREVSAAALNAALKINPQHIPSLLELADRRIDAEDYDGAEKFIAEVVATNPVQSDAWAYRAVVAHLRNDITEEATSRATALRFWPKNPRVDYLIGKKLSAKYRFAEGATYQRRAREADPSYLPATAQLANDLLRLGEETEGWALARAVHERDDYDVEAFNLVSLQDTMAKYATLASNDFVIRMTKDEAAIYGPRVLDLLTKAKQTLTTKYEVELANPTYVEIFADPKDFAVRTFGMPDVAGFLGVCFGRVVTANSPAAHGGRATNWEAVLWHEFCHVVTLQMTKNKMPRWLSEGISVYEERQASRAWGMRINVEYRKMILDGDMAQIAGLSASFLAPKSPRHLQFAYLQSSLVVEFIILRHGIDTLRGVLRDLRGGIEINAALAKNVAPLDTLEKEFAVYARESAEQLAPKLNFEKPPAELMLATANAIEVAAWESTHPDNSWLMMKRVRELTGKKNWAEARTLLERLVREFPTAKGADSVYILLAALLKETGDKNAERDVLTAWTAIDDEATEAYQRLTELAIEDKDWPAVKRNAERYLAVNPLVAPPWRSLAQASAESGDTPGAIAAWRTLLQLGAADPAGGHFQLAQLLRKNGEMAEARAQTLLALEEAPRFREALSMLQQLSREEKK
ncbi:MAG: tetratricopeptide repeat protein [Verrucomicrobia bacterium]|nr:tetratricopeptide repeat protein [Verrucomicrobiota bacterium]